MRKFHWIPCLAVAAVLTACSSSTTPSSTTQSSTSAAAPGTRAALSITDPYAPKIDPADFSTTIDNPYMPMVPGTRMIYEADTPDGKQRTVTEVTRDTKTVMGVKTVVVHDSVSVDGEQTEDTFDWFAQARDGSVWYFGEQTKEFADGKVDTAGSFEAGVDGALPGIVMPGSPQVGDKFRQEYAKGVAEDTGEVVDLHGADTTPLTGAARDLVVTKDADMLEPSAPAEHKFFAKGVGLILTVTEGQPPQRDQAVKIEKF
ncbi:MAG: hypothetical protein KDB72_03055 [Mycobacterium sp.]|nr:hypothetical protein [Mycobacterium sp.]